MNQANINYLIDEIKVEPIDCVAFENFNSASNIPPYVSQSAATENPEGQDHTSETFSVNIIDHPQSYYYIKAQNGTAHISGSGIRGAYFPDLSLMPATVYRLSADITASSSYDIAIKPYFFLEESLNGNFVPSGNLLGPATTVLKGETKHVEYLFRTKEYPAKVYCEDGIHFDKVGFITDGGYVIYDIDNMKVEKVNDTLYAGDMEDLTADEAGSKVFKDVYFGSELVDIIQQGGKDTTLIPVADDGTNGEYGDYLLANFVSINSENSQETTNNRRPAWFLNLKKNTNYRLSYRAKLVPGEGSEVTSKTLAPMYNVGKVDANGLTSGEEGYDSVTARYGYLKTETVTTEWQNYSTVFTTQNIQVIGQLYFGVDNYQPTEDIAIALDEIVIEDIGSGIYDAALTYKDGALKATESNGAQAGTLSDKNYTFLVSCDGVNFAKAGESTDGTFDAGADYIGKYMKAVVSATKEDGTKVSAETNAVMTDGFAFSMGGDSVEITVSAADSEKSDFEILIAQYDENGKMISVDNAYSVDGKAELSILRDEKTMTAKAFAWDMATLHPKTKEKTKNYKAVNTIACWGDSLTYGRNQGTMYSYPTALANLTGLTVYNMGVGGETATTIAARQGALDIVISEDFTIPADKTPVEIKFAASNGGVVTPRDVNAGGWTPCTINGVEGKLSIQIKDVWPRVLEWAKFTRSAEGEAVAVSAGDKLIPQAQSVKADVNIFFTGTNGGWTVENTTAKDDSDADVYALIDLIESQIAHTGSEKFVVIGLTSGTASTWDNTNAKLAEAFGENFLDVKTYLASEQALSDAGITPTATDLEYIAKGQIPKSLYCDDTDETHLSDIGYELLANQVYAKLLELEYLN